MGNTILTSANIDFIKKHRLEMSGTQMAATFKVSKSVVNRYMRDNNLQPPREILMKFRSDALKKVTSSTPEIDRKLKKYYLKLPVKTLAKKINKSHTFVVTRLGQLNLIIPREIIEQRKIDSRLKPGNVPANKGKSMSPELYEKCKATMFKAGRTNHNELYDGVITLRHNHIHRNEAPYYHIRLAKGKWVPLHTFNWEKKHGKVPKGHCLWFSDGNSLNPDPDNLELITRAENMRRNSCSLRLTDGYIAYTLCGKNNMHLYEEMLANKELIEVKRQQLLLRRKIKSHDTATN